MQQSKTYFLNEKFFRKFERIISNVEHRCHLNITINIKDYSDGKRKKIKKNMEQIEEIQKTVQRNSGKLIVGYCCAPLCDNVIDKSKQTLSK